MTTTPAPTSPPAIAVVGLLKCFGDHEVLRGLDLTVAPGTVHALLGSNGAGTTTAIRILSTLLQADGGRAAVDGHDVGSEPARVREAISLTGQFAAVDDVLTGRENLVLVGRLRHLAAEEMVTAERDAWILVAAQLPEEMPAYTESKNAQLDDPGVLETYRDLADVVTWPAEDPRLDAVFLDSVPGARRILRRLEHNGWTGWTNVRPIAPRA